MVVFTCNHCGDSLQKPKVAKHYDTTCRKNPIALTCVDCFKDFNLQEYVAHTKCMTEDQRYSAKGTAAKIQKGEVKQTEWVETVNIIIEQQKNAKSGIKNILQGLVNYSNIPRKKAKFLNFMTNAFKNKCNMRDIEEVWNLLEAHKTAQKNQPKENSDESNQETKSKKMKSEKNPENGVSEANVENGTSKETTQNGTSENKTKKKRKNKKTNGATETEVNGVSEANVENGTSEETTQNGTSENKTKKKRKNKKTNGTTETEEIPEKKQKLDETNDDTSSKKKKKSKQPETSETNGDTSVKKEKKTSECNDETNNSKLEESQNETFSFKQVIIDILTKKSKGLTKEALQNKVFKKYEATMGSIENKENLLKKYNKKLKALKNVTCDNDKYKIVSE